MEEEIMKVLMAYPNLPMMMAPAISVAIFNAISKEYGVEFRLFETTQYADEVVNRHIKMASYGANRGNQKDERDEEYFLVKPKTQIIPDFLEVVNEYEPDVILMSMQEDVYTIGTELLESIRNKNIPHIIGGVFPSQAPDVVMKNELIRCIAVHEGENTYRQLIESWKETGSFYNIDGIWWKDENNVIHKNKPASLCNIAQIIPDFSCYENKRWQRPMGGKHFYRAVSMETYRGCPYKCTYCNSPSTRELSKKLDLGNYMRRKPFDIVERDLQYYIEHIGPDLIMFQDDSFLARPPKEIFDFCEMWSKYKIPFWFNTRIENCKPEYLAALKEAGVYRMTFGLESGHEEYRKHMLERPIRNDIYYQYFDYINDSDIPYSLNVLIGMPFETRDMVMDTARVIKRAGGYDGLTISMFQPYHGTKLRQIAVDNEFLDDSIVLNGGYLDNWFLKMPEPYLQKDDVFALNKTFALYAYYEESYWELIKKSETDDELYDNLMKNYKEKFFTGDTQMGGNTKFKYCASHDISSTYNFIEMENR
jgi:anaerobic magnesium-protoporphyrin IX monomethyl ester cyclase